MSGDGLAFAVCAAELGTVCGCHEFMMRDVVNTRYVELEIGMASNVRLRESCLEEEDGRRHLTARLWVFVLGACSPDAVLSRPWCLDLYITGTASRHSGAGSRRRQVATVACKKNRKTSRRRARRVFTFIIIRYRFVYGKLRPTPRPRAAAARTCDAAAQQS